jgi:hypothetical protein
LGAAKTELDAPAFRQDLWDKAMSIRNGEAVAGSKRLARRQKAFAR